MQHPVAKAAISDAPVVLKVMLTAASAFALPVVATFATPKQDAASSQHRVARVHHMSAIARNQRRLRTVVRSATTA